MGPHRVGTVSRVVASGTKEAQARAGWGLTELAVALRWGALCISLAATALKDLTRLDLVPAVALAVVAVVRTIWPVKLGPGPATQGRASTLTTLSVAGELAVCGTAVGATGAAGSPFIFSMGAATFLFGLVVPAWLPVATAVATTGAVVVAELQRAIVKLVATQWVERVAFLAAAALLGSYSNWLLRAGGRDGKDVERLRTMGEVNRLLLELHAKAASLPASLNSRAALGGVVSRLQDLLHPDVVVLVLNAALEDRGDAGWEVCLAEGAECPSRLGPDELSPALLEAIGSYAPVCRTELAEGEGMAFESRSGLYVPLWAHERLLGVLAIERVRGPRFTATDLELVEPVAQHAGLAIDNAVWWRRLRALGAEEERGRIARELHDRVGQSLSYVALCLDRLGSVTRSDSTMPSGPEIADELGNLAAEVRRSARQIRTKLSDLRAGLGQDGEVSATLAGLLKRAEERSPISTSLLTEADGHLPPPIAREIAFIAQEAITNAERHSGAERLEVRWSCDGQSAELEVSDDGKGVPLSAPLRPDAFGILGMRERADAIGASLAITSQAGRGTKVALRWSPVEQIGAR
jgi:signal transduction histidine kinase